MSTPTSFAQPYTNFNEIYPRSNETNQEIVAQRLQETAQEGNYLHVGVSGMQNYNFIVLSKAKYAMLLDINNATCFFHQKIKETIQIAENVDDFVSRFLKTLEENNIKINDEHKCAIKEKKDLWLKSENWTIIKKMFQEENIEILNINIAEDEARKKIKKFYKLKHASLRTLYISNVADWLIDNKVELNNLQKNIDSLYKKNSNLIIIYSDGTLKVDKGQLEHHPIVQKIAFLKKEPLFSLYTKDRLSLLNNNVFTRRSKDYQKKIYVT